MRQMQFSAEAAETLSLRALAWLVGQEDLLPVFLGATGASEADLRARLETWQRDAGFSYPEVGATRTLPGKPPERAVVGLQVALSQQEDQWRVVDLVPISPAPNR